MSFSLNLNENKNSQHFPLHPMEYPESIRVLLYWWYFITDLLGMKAALNNILDAELWFKLSGPTQISVKKHSPELYTGHFKLSYFL